jgi:hypothetical protein
MLVPIIVGVVAFFGLIAAVIWRRNSTKQQPQNALVFQREAASLPESHPRPYDEAAYAAVDDPGVYATVDDVRTNIATTAFPTIQGGDEEMYVEANTPNKATLAVNATHFSSDAVATDAGSHLLVNAASTIAYGVPVVHSSASNIYAAPTNGSSLPVQDFLLHSAKNKSRPLSFVAGMQRNSAAFNDQGPIHRTSSDEFVKAVGALEALNAPGSKPTQHIHRLLSTDSSGERRVMSDFAEPDYQNSDLVHASDRVVRVVAVPSRSAARAITRNPLLAADLSNPPNGSYHFATATINDGATNDPNPLNAQVQAYQFASATPRALGHDSLRNVSDSSGPTRQTSEV